MKKIAILLDNPYISFHVKKIVEAFEKKQMEVILLLHSPGVRPFSLNNICYRFLAKAESKLTALTNKTLRPYLEEFHVTQLSLKQLFLTPQSDPHTVKITYPAKELEQLQELHLDLILVLEPGLHIGGDILTQVAKEGVLQLFYSDRHVLESKAIAFWEIFLRKDNIGFSIEKVLPEYNLPLFKGKIATFRQFTPMKVRLLREITPYVIQTVDTYLQKEKPLPEHKPLDIYASRILDIPTIGTQLSYIAKTSLLFASLIYKRIFQKRYSRFGVAFLRQNWQGANLSEGVEIKTPKNHFYADPFVWTKEGRTVCFVEDFDYTQNIAWISAVEIFEDNSYKILGDVIKEPFHMSFPYLFEYENELYMIPETTQAKSIRLYKCTEFPMKWEFQHELMKDVHTADTMVFPHDGKWWMLTNLSTPGNEDQAAQLFAFYNDSPLSTSWTPHKQNPVVFDSDCGRNGGILFTENGTPVRGRQKQAFNIYGAALSIAKIERLDENRYEEELIANIKPDFFEGLSATHHIHAQGNVTVYDFMRYEKLD